METVSEESDTVFFCVAHGVAEKTDIKPTISTVMSSQLCKVAETGTRCSGSKQQRMIGFNSHRFLFEKNIDSLGFGKIKLSKQKHAAKPS